MIEVLIVSRGRPSLARAIESALAQDLPDPPNVTLMFDATTTVAAKNSVPNHSRVRVLTSPNRAQFLKQGGGHRVARLRNEVVAASSAPMLAFLDDDNTWESNHLSSLLSILAVDGVAAAHSWRRVYTRQRQPHQLTAYPWARDCRVAAMLYERMLTAGVMSPDTNVIRDTARLQNNEPGMVDMGEWLVRRRVWVSHHFRGAASREEELLGLGEDDFFLLAALQQSLPLPCTQMATLNYTLGGLSNGI